MIVATVDCFIKQKEFFRLTVALSTKAQASWETAYEFMFARVRFFLGSRGCRMP